MRLALLKKGAGFMKKFFVPSRVWVGCGALSAFFAVALGAFGAHALAEKLDERMLAVFQTGSHYHLVHALALVIFGLWCEHKKAATAFPGWAFGIGTFLFSGSLYALAITGVRTLGMITPVGGILFLMGWLVWSYDALLAKKK